MAFNRSRLYRGYCVSERCRQQTITTQTTNEKNVSLSFEECVDKRVRQHDLSARLRRLIYCSTEKQHKEKAKQPPNSAQQLFMRVVYALLALNILGTVYDIITNNKNSKCYFQCKLTFEKMDE